MYFLLRPRTFTWGSGVCLSVGRFVGWLVVTSQKYPLIQRLSNTIYPHCAPKTAMTVGIVVLLAFLFIIHDICSFVIFTFSVSLPIGGFPLERLPFVSPELLLFASSPSEDIRSFFFKLVKVPFFRGLM